MTQLILASQSPRRKALLQKLGIPFEIQPSTINEYSLTTDPTNLVKELSLAKAKDVAMNCSDAIVIGADTIVVHNNDILGKPTNEQEAAQILARLSGNHHQVYTGVCLQYVDRQGALQEPVLFHELTKVWFQALSTYPIHNYVSSGLPMDKAGAYGIQDKWGAIFVKKIKGDFYNIVGLPLSRCYLELSSLKERYKLKLQ
ncbi:MAG: septum formation protein Maf [Balneola sp.]|nr:septum formation protein Maf [Balneola sp.]|tara:strand:- start:641 stop:1240 length:600 start_codon:yes stop_codon:yes gene_type:complete